MASDVTDSAGRFRLLRGRRRPAPAVEIEESAEFVSWMPAEFAEPAVSSMPAEPGPTTLPSSRTELAVRAACAPLLPPAEAAAAVSDVVAGFDAAEDIELLVALTRLMLAVSLPDRSSAADRRASIRASLAGEARCTCREAGPLFASRANGTASELHCGALERHLSYCPGCRAMGADIAAAEDRLRAAWAAAAEPDLPGGSGGPVSPEAGLPR
jgi:hypothetical protein